MSRSHEELGRLVAYVFQALGRRRISEDDWVRLLSLERQWVPPSRARRLAVLAQSVGLLRNAGDRDLEPGLETEGLVLPLDYRPDPDALDRTPAGPGPSSVPSEPIPLFRRLVREIGRGTQKSEAEAVGLVNSTQQALGGLLAAEVCALYYGLVQGVELRPFLDEVEAAVGGRTHVPK